MAGAFAADSIAKAQADRADALEKLAAVQAERDDLRKLLDDARRQIAANPKGSLKAVPVAVSKADDTGLPVRDVPEPETALDAIRAAHRRPRAT